MVRTSAGGEGVKMGGAEMQQGNVVVLGAGVQRALSQARAAIDPSVEDCERRAVALSAALCAQGVFNGLKRFRFDAVEAKQLRRRAELLVGELKALEGLCGGDSSIGGCGV